jgi:HAD superfamily hydrolase (TIGR01662 family)
MRYFEAVIFDLGSTLIYFDGEWYEVISQSIDRLFIYLTDNRLELDSESFPQQFRNRLDDYFTQREVDYVEYTMVRTLRDQLADSGYPDVSNAMIDAALKDMYSVSESHWHVLLEAERTLQNLCQNGYRLGMISNASDNANVQRLIDKAKIRTYFDIILSSAALGIRKPDPRIFQVVLDHWGFAPSKVVMVGDNLGADIFGAHECGMFSVWLTHYADKNQNRDFIGRVQPDATIEQLSELPHLLNSLTAIG